MTPGKRDKLNYKILADGMIVLSRAEVVVDESDPALGGFLHFLARDMEARPRALRAMDGALQSRLKSLVGGLETNLDAPLAPEDE